MARSFQTADDGFAITPGTTVFTNPIQAIYTGTGGNITLTTPRGTSLTFTGTLAGTILPVRATQVTAATATNLVGLLQY